MLGGMEERYSKESLRCLVNIVYSFIFYKINQRDNAIHSLVKYNTIHTTMLTRMCVQFSFGYK